MQTISHAPSQAQNVPTGTLDQQTITTDDSGLLLWKEVQQNTLRKTVLWGGVLMLLPLAILWLATGFSGTVQALLAITLLLAGLIAWTSRSGAKRFSRHYDQSLVVTRKGLVQVVAGKPKRILPYDNMWLGPDRLVIGRKDMPFRMKSMAREFSLWPSADMQRLLSPHIAPEKQFSSDNEMLMFMLRRFHGYAVQRVIRKILFYIAVIGLLFGKLIAKVGVLFNLF